MRNPNGFGSIKKLGGKRRRPYAVCVTTKYELAPKAKDITFLKEALGAELYAEVEAKYKAFAGDQIRATQKQKIIGYYETRPEAIIALAEYNKNPFDIDKRNTTFQQVYDILLETKFEKMKYQAKVAYTGAYKKCSSIANIRMAELRKSHMQAVVDEYSHKSKSLQNNLIKLFHAVYDFCLENDICEKNYAQFVEVSSEKEVGKKTPFSREEVKTLWDNLSWSTIMDRSPLSGLQLADSMLIMIYTGVRIGELLEIKVGDVNLNERWLNINGTKTKAAKRIVPIHKDIMPLLEKRTAGLGESEYLFKDLKGKAIEKNAYRKLFFVPLCERLGMQHNPHECRHSFATYAAASKLNPVLLKKMIGHAAQDITQDVYTHSFVEDLVAEIDKLSI